MPDYSNIKKGLSTIAMLERELNLKQLQINRLLNITQAINSNVSADGLFNMYSSFLSWEMGIKKMALYVLNENDWFCRSSIGISEELLELDITEELPKFTRINNLPDTDEHLLINEFDVVIPVKHKEQAIAYVFIGGFEANEDMYSKVQFITTITNIVAVAIENKRLFKQQIEQERLKREMELASEMQLMLVPSTLPSSECYELASIYKPQIGVGGDYFDFVNHDDDRFAFCIADISGKGLAAALLMANFQANLRSLILTCSSLDHFIEELNSAVFRITGGDRFITFFIGEFNEKTRELKYVNCGHNPPYLVMNKEIQLLDKGCTILGSFKKMPEAIEVGSCILDDEAMVLSYTDGLTDLKDNHGDFLNEQLLLDFLQNNYHASAKQFNDSLMKRIELFKGDQVYPDDFTVLTCKIFKQ